MKRLALTILIAACSKSGPDATTENGVRVNYVSAPALCNMSGPDVDLCVMDQGSTGDGVSVPTNAWACSRVVSKTSGPSGEQFCRTTITKCQEIIGELRKVLASKGHDEIVSAGDCEIWRVKK